MVSCSPNRPHRSGTRPNTPTPARCVSLRAAIAKAVDLHPGDLRVGLVASGGLRHFVIDEQLNRRVSDALQGRR